MPGRTCSKGYIERLGEMLGLFDGTGMTLVVENAGTLMHTVHDMLRLMDALGEAGLRLALDTGNFHLWGQDEVEATRLALPWTIHFHVKDYVDQHWVEPGVRPAATQVDLGTGNVRNLEALAVLKEANWEGVLAFEPHGDDSIEPGVKKLLEWLGK
jgi:sugar phosphate isomerase/epimerase